MRSLKPCVALIVMMLLVGCEPSKTREPDTRGVNPPEPDSERLLSTNRELLPLSPYFGVCAATRSISELKLISVSIGPHGPTGGEVTVEGGLRLAISVGKFDLLPDARLADVDSDGPGRRVQLGRDSSGGLVIVSDFENANGNRVAITYDSSKPNADAAALRFADHVVGCRLMRPPVETEK